jgi:nucleotide-binding universal stress UspA family protein
MHSIRRILVPTDFQPNSEAALECAVDLARLNDASVVVLHVLEIPVYAYPGAPFIPVIDITPDLMKAAQTGLDTTVEGLKRSCDVKGLLRRGSVFSTILDVVKEEQIDLVVMGTHGRKGLAHAVIGSVAEKIVRTSPVPVLTMHREKQNARELDTARRAPTRAAGA